MHAGTRTCTDAAHTLSYACHRRSIRTYVCVHALIVLLVYLCMFIHTHTCTPTCRFKRLWLRSGLADTSNFSLGFRLKPEARKISGHECRLGLGMVKGSGFVSRIRCGWVQEISAVSLCSEQLSREINLAKLSQHCRGTYMP